MWSMPYAYDPKDPTRQMVGGWLRRLLAVAAGSPAASDPPAADTAVGAAPHYDVPSLAYVADASRGVPLPQTMTQRDSAATTSTTRRLLGRVLRSLYRTADQRGAFWRDKKFMFSLSKTADYYCTRGEARARRGLLLCRDERLSAPHLTSRRTLRRNRRDRQPGRHHGARAGALADHARGRARPPGARPDQHRPPPQQGKCGRVLLPVACREEHKRARGCALNTA